MINEKFTEYIFNSIKENWDINAFCDYGKDNFVKYSDVAKHILKMHTIFKRMEIYKGDKIALCGANSKNWALTYLSIVSYGAVVVPILVDFAKDDIISILNDSGSKYLFMDKHILEKIDKEKLSFLNRIFYLDSLTIFDHKNDLTEEYNEILDVQLDNFSRETFSLTIFENDTLATIIYTSGTTGFSKGVMLNHNSLAANVRFAIENMPIKSNDHILSFLPLAHVFGCLLKPTIDKPLMKNLLNLPFISKILKNKICEKLTQSFGGNFHVVIVGGSALNEEVEKFLMDIGFKFTVGYGMTECGPLISYSPWDKHVARTADA